MVNALLEIADIISKRNRYSNLEYLESYFQLNLTHLRSWEGHIKL